MTCVKKLPRPHMRFWILLTCASLAACESPALYTATQNGDGHASMTEKQARDTLKRSLLSPALESGPASISVGGQSEKRIANVRVSHCQITTNTEGGDALVYPLSKVNPALRNAADAQGWCRVELGTGNARFPDAKDEIVLPHAWGLLDATSECDAMGKPIVDSIVALKGAAIEAGNLGSAENQARFAEIARSYQDASSKPRLPEAARAYQVQAEGAVRDKDFDAAEELFAKALEISPWWPEGHYNRALVLAENGDFGLAVIEMQRYLALVPNASNARAAQDRVYDWQRKIK